ncbi:GGDEF domain-containing protein [Halomonas sp. KAO]|uniref:GGDEF domain-containing protein n=1 Tax=unclassified Halomonas TaxID=2609666 RepID=UPI00189F0D42|nr:MULTISPECIES: GGDEF domain-containing protein [unclassified Halomonas]MBF7054977.1 GGDEF domain-containing protein [Halomonas sp. KAO]MDT0501435.1 GGDEF domain-containing protein [Halomonas sp. PAR7]MDT0512891.1 GGDEF domain-containing protein [Halomonas sp. LES1]MDT0591284.1 GGDEF domain-containing protein [Halomonas sp. PAR8]
MPSERRHALQPKLDGEDLALPAPGTTHHLHRLTGQFHEQSREALYRRSIEPRVRTETGLALSVASLIYAMFAISDYFYTGLTPEFFLLTTMRTLVVVSCLTLAVVIGRRGNDTPHVWLHALPLWILATGIILIVPLRPETLSTQVPAVVVATMAFYLLIPNLLPVAAVASLYLGIGFLVASVMAADAPAVVVMRTTLLLIMTNGVGFFTLLRLEKLQRKQFALLQEERVQNRQLVEEITHRRSLEAQLRRLAEQDALTGLDSRRHFMTRAEAMLRRSRHAQAPFCLFMIDVDHFKAINDTWGHDQGDRVLTAIAEACQRSLRPQDVIGRFGGEEFIVALPETHLKDARMVAERLRRQVSELTVMEAVPAHRLTVTIGIAGVRDEEADLDDLIQRADRALYAGKHGGRNRVVSHEGSEEAPSTQP